MIIRLNENKFNRIFLFEGNGSRAARQTRELIAQDLNTTPDDPEVVEAEQDFKREYFGEGRDTDWFITIEPFVYKWLSTAGPFYNLLDGLLGTIKSKAETSQNRTAFMQQVKSFQTFNEMRNFIGELVKQDRINRRENKIEPNLNPRYGKPLGPLSFEESNEYGKFSGVDAGKGGGCICYTTQTGQREGYSNRERNKLYLLLREDWKTVNTTHDGSEVNNGLKGLNMHLNRGDEYYSGYDDYGLSMIFVWINPEGELAYCNTRWNHRANYAPGHGVDNALNEQDIEHLMGAPFGEIFNVESFYDKVDNAHEELVGGKSKGIIFNSYEQIGNTGRYIVNFKGKYNVYIEDEKRFLFPHDWFDFIQQINGYGDLKIGYQNSESYFDADSNKFWANYFQLLINAIANRLAQGVNPNMFFRKIENYNDIHSKFGAYCTINKFGDLFITTTENGGRNNFYFDGKTLFTSFKDYFEIILERLNKGCNLEDVFTKVENSPLGYSLVKMIPVKDFGECWIFADGEIKYASEYFNDARIFNKLGHSIIKCSSHFAEKIIGHTVYGPLYFDGTKFYETDEYYNLINELIKNGVNINDIFSDVKYNENVPNYLIVSLPYDVLDVYKRYTLFDLNSYNFVFKEWFQEGEFLDYKYFDEANNLITEVAWINLKCGDTNSTYYAIPVINGKLWHYNNQFPSYVWRKLVKLGPLYGFVVAFEDDHYNILGKMEDRSIGFVFNGVDIDELPYEIEIPDSSSQYIVLRFEEESDKKMIPYWKVVSDEEFVQYINEELEDGEYLSAFGEWDDANDLFGVITFADNGSNIIDKRNMRLILKKNVYGGIRPIEGSNSLVITSYCGEYKDNIMRENGTLLINTENACEWPIDIKPAYSDKKELYLVELDDYEYNIMDENGHILSETNFRSLTKFYNGICIGEGNGWKKYFIDENGKVLNKKNPISYYDKEEFRSPSLTIPISCTIWGKEGNYKFSKTTHKFRKCNR